MLLSKLGQKKVIPLVISGSILTSFPYTYGALDKVPDQNNNVIDTAKDIVISSNNNIYTKIYLESVFKKKLHEWKMNTMFASMVSQIVSDKSFQEIVSFGECMVPFILEEIEKEPSPLVWALNIIFDKKISTKTNLTIEEACKLWIKEL